MLLSSIFREGFLSLSSLSLMTASMPETPRSPISSESLSDKSLTPLTFRSGLTGTGNIHTTLHQNQDMEQLFGGNERQGLGPRYSPSADKGTLKSRIKVFSKLRKCKKPDSGFSPVQLQRTYSLHHLEPSAPRLDEISKNKKSEIIFLPGTLDTANKSSRIDKLKEEADICHSVEGEELIQVIKGNGDDGTEIFLPMLPNFSRKERFTKSGSFPSADMSRKMNFSPSKLENKKNEIWVSSGGGLQSRNSIQKYKKHSRAKSWNFTSGSEEMHVDEKLFEHFQNLKTELKNEASSKCCIELDKNSDVKRDFIHRKSYSSNDSPEIYSRLLEFTSSLEEESSIYTGDLEETIDSSMINRIKEEDTDYSENSAEFIQTPIQDSNAETLQEKSSIGNKNFENENEKGSDLFYVRELMARFCKYITNDIWLSPEHPLMNDDVFEAVEADWHQESESENEDGAYGHYTHHQILFDVVNEAILYLHDRTSLYYPMTLSSSFRVHTVPIGRRVVEEIIAITSSFLSRKAKENETVDDIVHEDVVKDDGWMKIHPERECVALEVEDMIADDLLEELLFAELVELQ